MLFCGSNGNVLEDNLGDVWSVGDEEVREDKVCEKLARTSCQVHEIIEESAYLKTSYRISVTATEEDGVVVVPLSRTKSTLASVPFRLSKYLIT